MDRQRRLPFVGATNFRDIGGYVAADGRTTRWRRVFRSDAPHRMTTEDLEAYAELGVRAVYDLRTDVERAQYPNPFPSEHLPLLGQSRVAGMLGETDGERILRDMYCGLLVEGAPLFGRLLTEISDSSRLPVVIHCTGGKDRTGITVALLLELLGVRRQVVLDDYELTSRYRLREHQQESYDNMVAAGMAPEAAAAVLGAPRAAMSESLKALDVDFGGALAYAIGPAGLSQSTVETLSELLTE